MLLGIVFGVLVLTLVWLTLTILVGVGGFLWAAHPVLLTGIVAGATAGMWLAFRGSHRAATIGGLPGSGRLHPGIRIHSIPVAGGIGLVFVLGYVAMFWFGLPGARPVVVATTLVGLAFGAGLIWLAEQRSARKREAELLHLRER
jgi:hypothetical protein